MSETPSERFVAHQTQEKFQFYFLSLVFTLLALAVQTAEFGHSRVADALELAGWTGLLVSGLAALSRLEWDATFRMRMTQLDEWHAERFRLVQELQRGTLMAVNVHDLKKRPVAEAIKARESAIQLVASTIGDDSRTERRIYKTAKFAFLVGLLCVVLARASIGFAGLFGYRLL